jgi:hypothetical protein
VADDPALRSDGGADLPVDERREVAARHVEGRREDPLGRGEGRVVVEEAARLLVDMISKTNVSKFLISD